MKLPNIISTISFKLSALYLILFLCSFLSIGITVYWLTQQSLETQLKDTLEAEAKRLKAEFDADGIAELQNEIAEVAGHNADTLFEYGLIDQNRRLLAGTLDNFKLSEG
jgi:cell division protein FtsL